jgi:hypothetical protein
MCGLPLDVVDEVICVLPPWGGDFPRSCGGVPHRGRGFSTGGMGVMHWVSTAAEWNGRSVWTWAYGRQPFIAIWASLAAPRHGGIASALETPASGSATIRPPPAGSLIAMSMGISAVGPQ